LRLWVQSPVLQKKGRKEGRNKGGRNGGREKRRSTLTLIYTIVRT
jgi:hypothetical protein